MLTVVKDISMKEVYKLLYIFMISRSKVYATLMHSTYIPGTQKENVQTNIY